MQPSPQAEVTQLLAAWRQGDADALNRLFPMVEVELRRLAQRYMKGERNGHTLQPTALVNEAWMQLQKQSGHAPALNDRGHFIAIAAHTMRRILVSHARKKTAEKRGGAQALEVQEIEENLMAVGSATADVLRLDDGLNDLAKLDARQAKIIEMHYFGGLEYEEIAQYLEISRSTVMRDVKMAQLWLRGYVAG